MIDLRSKKLILASKSPRRAELLKGLGLDFEVRTKDVKEDFPEEMPVEKVAEYLSEKKAAAFQDDLRSDEILLTSDTVVIVGDKVLGKPADLEEARAMIRTLSGKEHLVISAITFKSTHKTVSLSDSVKVSFKSLTAKEIDYYVETFRPLDKAGAYGIQEWIGYIGVLKIEGSYFTVMGLPVHLVYDVLKEWEG
jgi:septum formation protein